MCDGADAIKNNMTEMRLAFVDLETTGGSAGVDRITEIGIVEVDGAHGSPVREWASLVNPQTRIPEFIQQLTGISNAMVASAPTFAELAPIVAERLEGRIFAAHNARFDYGFLKAEFARVGIEFRATVLCTVKLSRRLFPEHKKHSLDSVIERHRLDVDHRHRALDDARAIAQFWHQIQGEVAEDVWRAAVDELTAAPRFPPQLDPHLIDSLPETAGVYLLYGENDVVLHVGKSRTLKRRILAHFAAKQTSAAAVALFNSVRRIKCVQRSDASVDLDALLAEIKRARC
jgi:DNA polymerase-3 subunit epsilon